MRDNSTIKYLGEYEQHIGTIVMCPFRNDIWRDNAAHMQRYILDLINIVAKYEHVYVIRHPDYAFPVNEIAADNVTVIDMKYNDIWARDIAPTYVKRGNETVCINWKFNAWGGEDEGAYYPWDDDDAFATKIAAHHGYHRIDADMTLEDGAIVTDGAGTVFTTKSVLLNKNRNPRLTQKDAEVVLKELLGAKKIIWLDEGLEYDETGGHIDNVLTVVRAGEICLSWTDDKSRDNHRRMSNAYDVLSSEYSGIIRKIPLPPVMRITADEEAGLIPNSHSLPRRAGDGMIASYANIYTVNGGVIIPSYGCEEDEIVRRIYAEIFPDRTVEQIYSREPSIGGGGIHCLLHEIPE